MLYQVSDPPGGLLLPDRGGAQRPHGLTVSRADLAAFLLTLVVEPGTVHQQLFVAA